MDFYLGRSDWKTLQRGEEHSFLLVNGLGGYCSQTVICSNARHDHNLLTAALVAPTKRFAMVRRIEEILHVGSNAYRLDSQAYVTSSDDAAGFRFLDSCFYDGLPSWEYMQYSISFMQMRAWMHGLRLFQCMVFIQKMIVHLHTRRLAAEKKKIAFLCQQKRQVCILIQMVISSR